MTKRRSEGEIASGLRHGAGGPPAGETAIRVGGSVAGSMWYALLMVVMIGVTAPAQPLPGFVGSREFVFTEAPFASAHASTIVEMTARGA